MAAPGSPTGFPKRESALARRAHGASPVSLRRDTSGAARACTNPAPCPPRRQPLPSTEPCHFHASTRRALRYAPRARSGRLNPSPWPRAAGRLQFRSCLNSTAGRRPAIRVGLLGDGWPWLCKFPDGSFFLTCSPWHARACIYSPSREPISLGFGGFHCVQFVERGDGEGRRCAGEEGEEALHHYQAPGAMERRGARPVPRRAAHVSES